MLHRDFLSIKQNMPPPVNKFLEEFEQSLFFEEEKCQENMLLSRKFLLNFECQD